MVKPECPSIEAKPVLDHRGFVLLFDLWVAGKWVGSRRTAEQCESHLSHITGFEIETTGGTAW